MRNVRYCVNIVIFISSRKRKHNISALSCRMRNYLAVLTCILILIVINYGLKIYKIPFRSNSHGHRTTAIRMMVMIN